MKCLAIFVNYHCSGLIVEAVKSVVASGACTWIRVVDNSMSATEAANLQRDLPPEAELIIAPGNLGFGRACNLAIGDLVPDSVLLLNPDARLLAGALESLQRTLRDNPKAAAVGPRVFWDDACEFSLPPSTYPSRWSFLMDLLAERFSVASAYKARKFRERSIAYWQAHSVIRVEALSGGHVLLRFSALQAIGGLFDPRFFMYWEDSDLMRRLQDDGWQLLMDPHALALHCYEHNAAKDGAIGHGWNIYQQKYFSGPVWKVLSRLARLKKPRTQQPALQPLLPTPGGDYCVQVAPQVPRPWLMEVSPSIDFVPSIARTGTGEMGVLPYALAQRFKDRNYYIRIAPLNARPENSVIYTFNVGLS